jgi:hypothetical protein
VQISVPQNRFPLAVEVEKIAFDLTRAARWDGSATKIPFSWHNQGINLQASAWETPMSSSDPKRTVGVF